MTGKYSRVHHAPLSWPKIVVTRILTRDLFGVANLLVLIFCAVVQQQSHCVRFSPLKSLTNPTAYKLPMLTL